MQHQTKQTQAFAFGPKARVIDTTTLVTEMINTQGLNVAHVAEVGKPL